MADRKIHYSWLIGSIGCFCVFLSVGLTVTTFSAHIPYLINQMSMTHTQNSVIRSLQTISGALAVLLSGFYYRKLSLRYGVAVALLCEAIGMILFGVGRTYWIGYIAGVLNGISYTLAGMIAVSLLITNWFEKNRGMWLGICAAGSGAAALIMPKITVYLIESYSLQFEFLLEACLCVTAAVIVIVFVRDTPEEKGLSSYGKNEEIESIESGVSASTIKYLPTRKHHLCMCTMCFLMGGFSQNASVFMPVHLSTAGFPSQTAATMITVLGAVLVVSKIVYGWASDLFSQLWVASVYTVCYIIANYLLSLAHNQIYIIQIVAAILFGIAGPLGSAGIAVFAMDMSTTKTYGKCLRVYSLVYSAGAAALSPIAGKIADFTGSYNLVYVGFALLSACGLIIIQIAYRGARKRYLSVCP